MFGEMKRGLTVLKMRGSTHDKAIREFTIDKGGMQMGRAFNYDDKFHLNGKFEWSAILVCYDSKRSSSFIDKFLIKEHEQFILYKSNLSCSPFLTLMIGLRYLGFMTCVHAIIDVCIVKPLILIACLCLST